jgi:hypothetical protein
VPPSDLAGRVLRSNVRIPHRPRIEYTSRLPVAITLRPLAAATIAKAAEKLDQLSRKIGPAVEPTFASHPFWVAGLII